MIARADILTGTTTIAVEGSEAPMGAYVARPAGDWPGRGVIAAPELFGISAHVRDVCERLAQMGYVALAPDLHHRTAPGVELPHDAAGRERGFALLGRMTRDQALDDVKAAREHLRGHGCERVGMLGLSLGGHVAYLAATEVDLPAVAVFYAGWLTTTEIPLGRPEPTLTRTGGITGRVLVLVGEQDHVVPSDDRRAISNALRSASVEHEVVEYPGVGHGFLSDRRSGFDPAAAQDAWQRVDALLSRSL